VDRVDIRFQPGIFPRPAGMAGKPTIGWLACAVFLGRHAGSKLQVVTARQSGQLDA
jgi:hypothetical protein